MTFQFIDNATIDRRTMRMIRSHAAKGRNIGKGRPRRKQLPLAIPTTTLDSTVVVQTCDAEQKIQDKKPPLEHPLGDEVALIPMEWDLSPSSRIKLRRLLVYFALEFRPSYLKDVVRYDVTKSLWVRLIFIDEAYFHCIVAMLNDTCHFSLMGPEDSTESLQHLNRTFRLVNENLSGPNAVADATFAAVVAMTQYYQLRSELGQALVHLDGLERMVNLCGGIVSLRSTHPALAHKVFRVDLQLATHLGTPTRFGIDEQSVDQISDFLGTEKANFSLYETRTLAHCSAELKTIKSWIMRFSRLVNRAAKLNSLIDGRICDTTVVFIGQKLVSICPFQQLPLTDSRLNMLFLGLCAFITAFLTGLNGRFQTAPLLNKSIKLAMTTTPQIIEDWHQLRLWTLVMGRTTIFTSEDDAWICSVMRESSNSLHLLTFQDLRKALIEYPWIDTLHESTLVEMYRRISESPAPLPL